MLKKKIVNYVLGNLVAMTVVGNTGINAFAQTLGEHYLGDENNSTPSESWDGNSIDDSLHEVELEGTDEFQDKKATQIVNISEYQESYEVEVYASLASEFTVSIPKIITLDATGEKESGFIVGVKGALAPNYAVTSTPSSNFELINTRDERQKFNASISSYTDSLTLFYGWNLISQDVYNGDGMGYYIIENEKAPMPGAYTGTFNICFDLIDLSLEMD